MEAILGAGKEVTSSSDEVEHKLEREQFSQKYQEMHRLVREADGSTVLYIGAENWPFPMGSDCDLGCSPLIHLGQGDRLCMSRLNP